MPDFDDSGRRVEVPKLSCPGDKFSLMVSVLHNPEFFQVFAFPDYSGILQNSMDKSGEGLDFDIASKAMKTYSQEIDTYRGAKLQRIRSELTSFFGIDENSFKFRGFEIDNYDSYLQRMNKIRMGFRDSLFLGHVRRDGCSSCRDKLMDLYERLVVGELDDAETNGIDISQVLVRSSIESRVNMSYFGGIIRD